MKNTKPLKKLIISICIFLALAAGITVLFDPFYHYHKPLSFLKAVLNDRDHQVVGTLDHFDYDAVIIGTSIAENINNHQVDEALGVTSVKAIRAGGSNGDILYYLDRAYENQDLKAVIYAIGLDEFDSDTEPTFPDMDYYYLIDKNPFNDLEYLLNKDVLLKKIPMQIGYSFFFDYDEGESYSWYKTKTFSKDEVISRYEPLKSFEESVGVLSTVDLVLENATLLKERILAHPETTFYLYTSPRNSLWWDNAYRTGMMENYLAYLQTLYDELSGIENVRFYNFIFDQEISFNLDNFMDSVHYSQYINSELVTKLFRDNPTSSLDNEKITIDFIKAVVDFSESGIKEYYPEAVVKH